MYIRKMLFIIIATLMLFLCACSEKEISETPTIEPTEASTVTPTIVPTEAPTVAPTVEPTVVPVARSYTTGLPIDSIPIYKPVGVMIENSKAARPQTGLQVADIVYEAPVEGCTRFFCIYNDTLPSVAGPVRSARLYYIKIQQEWDCAYVHFGGPESGKSNVYRASSDHIKTRINLIKGAFNDYYWRTDDRKAPHNAYTDVEKCQELVKEESKVRSFLYADVSEYTGETISSVTLPFYSGEVTYKYDDKNDMLLRYMGDKEFTDAETGEAIKVKNLIVQYVKFYHGGEAKGRWLCDQLGSGKAEFFIAGKHIIGTWERESYEVPTIYKDAEGKEIVLTPGNTWIALHPKKVDIVVEK